MCSVSNNVVSEGHSTELLIARSGLRNLTKINLKTSRASYYSNAFSLKVILEKHGKPLKTLLPVAPTMVPLFLILVSFLMLLMTIFQQLGRALPMRDRSFITSQGGGGAVVFKKV